MRAPFQLSNQLDRLLRRFPAIRRKVEQHVKEKFSATLSEIADQQSDKIDELD